ncbi:MAG: hypothetical protein Q8P25_02830 [Candidatus Curtissbacteria bacterium]|nr:hypothetical protein [Candidatus Curtissbacteria bacterium]
MQVHSYRHYLDSLDNKTDTGLLGKILLIVGIVILVVVGVTSSLLYYESKKETPIRRQAAYIQNTNNTLISINQSVDEILTSFQVAGAKIQIVDDLKESSAAASGFFTSLDDLERSLSKLELMNKNLENTKLSFMDIDPPQDLENTKDGVITFIVDTQLNLEDIYTEQNFVKDVLYASGPSFYLPILTDETIWKQNNKDAIINYYSNVKLQADETLKSLSKLTPPEVYKSYFDTQTAYLILFVNVSDKIINILAQKDSLNPDEATQIEKAYQQLIHAKGDNEKISETLLLEKKKIFDLARNQQKFARIKAQQNLLLSDLEQKYVALPPLKIDNLPLPLQIKTFLLIDKD